MLWTVVRYGLGIAALMTIFVMVVAGLRAHRRPFCLRCFFPLHRCECDPGCLHRDQTPQRWSQDGFVSMCRDCGEIVYHGDE